MRHGSEGAYLVEFVRAGASVKVTAVDPVTLREASIIGPSLLPRRMLARQAVNKLEYLLRKDSGAA